MKVLSEKHVEQEQLERGLENRHIQLIAIGGTIGVGLFLGSATAIKTAGPSLMLSYAFAGLIVFLILRALGELAIKFPVSGSFGSYATMYVGEWAGYITNWTYWYGWIIAAICETTAVGVYMKFWYPDLPQGVTAFACLIIMCLLNLIAVKVFGELEFWFALIKVVTIIGMIVIGGAMILFGVGNGGEPIGFSNLWTHGGFFPKGISGWVMSMTMVTFAYAGVELIGITAGEAKDPEKTLPSAIDKLFWRILIFYVGAITVILSIYPWESIGTVGSPFVAIFDKLGITAAASIINFVVITAALSSCNSAIYICGRMLYSLAVRNEAPAVFTKLNKGGVPANAIFLSTALAMVGVVLNFVVPDKVFVWITSLSVSCTLWAWMVIPWINMNYRKGLTPDQVAAGKFNMPFWPVGNYIIWLYVAFIIVSMAIGEDSRVALYVAPFWYIGVFAAYHLYAKPKKLAAAKAAGQVSA